MIDDYTRLLEATAELEDKAASDAAITKLIMHLKSAGRMKMLPAIARELRKVAARRHALRPYVEVAHQKEEAHALHAAAELGIIARHAVVNPSLIQGWRARAKGTLVDHSAKRALLRIYQQVTV
jgi:F0F1-type ATP synthase delta subunit